MAPSLAGDQPVLGGLYGVARRLGRVHEGLERPPLLTNSASDPAAPTIEQIRLEDARKLARENPVAVANIVKNWIGSEAPA